MSEPSREIFMKNGAYLMCKILDHTSESNTLGASDFMLCFHESKGEFIANQGYGTWCETDVGRIFAALKAQPANEETEK